MPGGRYGHFHEKSGFPEVLRATASWGWLEKDSHTGRMGLTARTPLPDTLPQHLRSLGWRQKAGLLSQSLSFQCWFYIHHFFALHLFLQATKQPGNELGPCVESYNAGKLFPNSSPERLCVLQLVMICLWFFIFLDAKQGRQVNQLGPEAQL